MPHEPTIDPNLTRVETGGFVCPLGAYPTDPKAFAPLQGYHVEFEPADKDDDEGWEEWPDRYVYDVVITQNRLKPLARALFALLPGRLYPILDVYGHDAYREIDPYIAYEPLGFERFSDGHRRFREWLYEDGFVGFGAMSLDPFMHVYVDEHKIITVRAESGMRERVERALAAFDLRQTNEPLGVDSVEHEHRDVLAPPDADPDAATRDDIVEALRDQWGLTLNIDPETNVDDDGNEIGACGWRCVVRRYPEQGPPEEAEVLLVADTLGEAERSALSGLSSLPPIVATPRATHPDDAEGDQPGPAADPDDAPPVVIEAEVVTADRVTPEELASLLGAPDHRGLLDVSGVHAVRRLTPRGGPRG